MSAMPSPVFDPACREFLCSLYLRTLIDPMMYHLWMRKNLPMLRAQFAAANEHPDKYAFKVWCELYYTTGRAP
jgi:hypothetical protein